MNPVQNRDTPGWQKPITNFFQKADKLPPIEPDDKDDAQLPYRNLDVEMGPSNKVGTERDDKENTPPSTSKVDEKVGENGEVANKRSVSVEGEMVENTVVVPYKKQKLDCSVFQGLEEWEA